MQVRQNKQNKKLTVDQANKSLDHHKGVTIHDDQRISGKTARHRCIPGTA